MLALVVTNPWCNPCSALDIHIVCEGMAALVGVAGIIVYLLRPPALAMATMESHDRDCRTGWLLVEIDFSSTIQEKKRLSYGNRMFQYILGLHKLDWLPYMQFFSCTR